MTEKITFSDIINDKTIRINGVYHCSGQAILHSITVSKIGKRYRCDMQVSGKNNIKTIKTVEITSDIDKCYNSAWKDQLLYAINIFSNKENEKSSCKIKLLNARLDSQRPDKSCKGKKAYRTPEYAEKICNEMKKKYEEEFNYYFCHFCACYHIGHIPFWTKVENVS